MLKTIDSKRTRAVFGGGLDIAFEPLASRCGAIIVLTGTPLPNRPREAYVLARNLCWDSIDFLSEEDFRERFNPSLLEEKEVWDVEQKKFKTIRYIDERSGRHLELQNRMRANFMVRHLKREVMKQLKMPVFDIIQMEETGPVKQALAAEKLLDIDPETFTGADKEVIGDFATARRQMGEALAPQVAQLAEDIIDGGEEKLCLVGWHHSVLDIWCDKLAHLGAVRVDGRTPAKVKEKLKDQFIEDPRIKLCIGNMQSMGVGMDGLQLVCNHMLIGEPSPVPSDNEQTVDRLDRGGQDRTVQVEFCVAPNSIMERILAKSLRKMQITHKALDAGLVL